MCHIRRPVSRTMTILLMLSSRPRTADRDEQMHAYVFGFQEAGRTDIGVAGGKGANLGELSRVEGIRVPDGFCISTGAFKRIMGAAPGIGDLLDRLALLKAKDREAIRELAAAIR